MIGASVLSCIKQWSVFFDKSKNRRSVDEVASTETVAQLGFSRAKWGGSRLRGPLPLCATPATLPIEVTLFLPLYLFDACF